MRAKDYFAEDYFASGGQISLAEWPWRILLRLPESSSKDRQRKPAQRKQAGARRTAVRVVPAHVLRPLRPGCRTSGTAPLVDKGHSAVSNHPPARTEQQPSRGGNDTMRARDTARYLAAWERLLDKGIVTDREVTFDLPSLDLDLLGLNVHTVVRSWQSYLDEVGEAPMVDALPDEVEDALPPDGPLPGQEVDGPGRD